MDAEGSVSWRAYSVHRVEVKELQPGTTPCITSAGMQRHTQRKRGHGRYICTCTEVLFFETSACGTLTWTFSNTVQAIKLDKAIETYVSEKKNPSFICVS